LHVGVSASLVAIARQRAGISQRELALRIGVPTSTIARWESAEHTPSLEKLRAVASACDLDVTIGLANLDDSYAPEIAAQLARSPTARVNHLASGSDPLAVADALHNERVRYVLIGEVAAAAHGWPVALSRSEYLIVPEDAPRNLARLEDAARLLGATEHQVDDPYRGLDSMSRWSLPDGGSLAASLTPAGTRGYSDLRRGGELIALDDTVLQVACLRDLIRIADASPRPERRAYLPALWATLEQTEQDAQREHRAA
jgi:transcriptional regulator with XRE-family HTH domain